MISRGVAIDYGTVGRQLCPNARRQRAPLEERQILHKGPRLRFGFGLTGRCPRKAITPISRTSR